jgi:hypothetical protein
MVVEQEMAHRLPETKRKIGKVGNIKMNAAIKSDLKKNEYQD